MDNNRVEKGVYDTQDLMVYLDIGRDRALALMKLSGFPSFRIGKTYCVLRKSFEEWLKKREGREIVICVKGDNDEE